MERCKTCKFWDREGFTFDSSGGHCVSGKMLEDGPGERNVYQPDQLVYPYSEGGWFWTGPEFGCVHHQPKE